jgi:hypothetical protein
MENGTWDEEERGWEKWTLSFEIKERGRGKQKINKSNNKRRRIRRYNNNWDMNWRGSDEEGGDGESGILLVAVADKVIVIFVFIYHWDSAEWSKRFVLIRIFNCTKILLHNFVTTAEGLLSQTLSPVKLSAASYKSCRKSRISHCVCFCDHSHLRQKLNNLRLFY